MSGPVKIYQLHPARLALQQSIGTTAESAIPADATEDMAIPAGVNEDLYRQLCAPMTGTVQRGLSFPQWKRPAPMKGWLLAVEGNFDLALSAMTEGVQSAHSKISDFARTVDAETWQPPAPGAPRADRADLVVRHGTNARMWAYLYNASVEAVSNIRKTAERLGLTWLRARVAGQHAPVDEELLAAWSAFDKSVAHLAALNVFDQNVLDTVDNRCTTLVELWRTTAPFMDVVRPLPAISWNR